MHRILIPVLALMMVFLPDLVLAVGYNSGQIFPERAPDEIIQENGRGIFDYISIAASTLLKVVAALVVIMLLYSGFLFITAQAEEETLNKARQVFISGIIGFIIVVISWTMVKVIVYLLK